MTSAREKRIRIRIALLFVPGTKVLDNGISYGFKVLTCGCVSVEKTGPVNQAVIHFSLFFDETAAREDHQRTIMKNEDTCWWGELR